MRFPRATVAYIICIVCINSLFVHAPAIMFHGSLVSSADFVVGIIYVLRDFAQREIKHYVLVAMAIAAALSYALADHSVAYASVMAFICAEGLEWAIFTLTKKPLSQRILWSSLISTPVDSFVFLYYMQMANVWGVTALTVGKMVGVLGIWGWWRWRRVAASVSVSPVQLEKK
jgi:uncharacterized PurR-regulated membrane protein YhhQ (DUF165 family)